MKKWYSINYTAARSFTNYNYLEHIKACSEEEAVGIAYKKVYKEHPVKDGWRAHYAQALLCPLQDNNS